MKNNFCIVTQNLNMGEYLEETIKSVIYNMKEGDEYYIIDGGSSDNSIDIIKKYEKKITKWVSEKDKSYADAISKGFALSDATYQCWIGSGDLLLKNSLENARKLLSDSTNDMIYGDDLFIDRKSKIIRVSNGNAANLFSMMYSGWTPLQDACFWRKSLYDKVGGINPEIRYAADYDLFLRMSYVGKCQYQPYVFSAFRQHDDQTSQKHKLDYKKEKLKSISNFSEANSPKTNLIKETYYWLIVRLKSRFFSHYKINIKPTVAFNLESSKTVELIRKIQ